MIAVQKETSSDIPLFVSGTLAEQYQHSLHQLQSIRVYSRTMNNMHQYRRVLHVIRPFDYEQDSRIPDAFRENYGLGRRATAEDLPRNPGPDLRLPSVTF